MSLPDLPSELTMNATEYKKYHESFMENNHGSSASHTFFCIFFTVQCSVLCSIWSQTAPAAQYFHEYLIIILPLILAHTVYSHYIYVLNLIIFTILMFNIVKNHSKLNVRKSLERPNSFPTKKIQLISILRGLTYLITVFSILAVDFKAFPRYLAKTERFGFSFMDTGVGLFVLMSGFVHKDLKTEKFTTILKGNFKFITVLVILGIARFLSVKQLDYHEHVTEYGVHWNFFFTLAVCKLLGTVILYISNKTLMLSLVFTILHEFLLSFSLQKWVFSNTDRNNFLNANREGISSSLGYVSLYIFAVYIKNILHNNSVPRRKILTKLCMISLLEWINLFALNIVRPISRTLANASYCMYLEAIFVTLTTVLYVFEVLFQNKEKRLFFNLPLILDIVNKNGLVYFLAANLLTGLVNLSMRTLFISNVLTVILLNIYMVISLVIAYYIKLL